MAFVDTLYEKYYLEFASYSIKNRAIPSIDDGFKPVQRRILHAPSTRWTTASTTRSPTSWDRP